MNRTQTNSRTNGRTNVPPRGVTSPAPKAARVLQDLTAPTAEQRRIAELEALLASAKAANARSVKLRVTADGRKLSFYHGHGRFPITAYRAQWLALLDNADAIRKLVLTLPEKGE